MKKITFFYSKNVTYHTETIVSNLNKDGVLANLYGQGTTRTERQGLWFYSKVKISAYKGSNE